mgnify:CR=1 FL=1
MEMFFWGVEYVASFLEVVMCFYFCGNFIDKESIKKKHGQIMVASILSAFIIIGLNRIKMFSNISSLLFLVICDFFLWIIYKKALLSTVLILIYAVLLSAIDFLTIYLMSFSLHTKISILINEHSLKRVVCVIFSKAFLTMLVMIISKVYGKKRVISLRYVIMTCLSSLFLLLSNFVTIGSIRSDNKIFSIFFLAILIGIQMLLFYFVLNMTDYYEQQQMLTLIEMKNDMLQKSLDDTEQTFELWKQSIHDYKNNIISLTQLAEDGNIDEIKRYLKRENKLLDTKMFYTKTGNTMVDAMVNTKQKIAEKKEIIFLTNIIIPKKCRVNGIDLANILGNLIDNAMEACEKEDNAYIDINIKPNKKFLMIVIKNKFKGGTMENMETTKNNKKFHGIGLKSVKNIVENYNGEISFDIDKNEFCVTILLLNE